MKRDCKTRLVDMLEYHIYGKHKTFFTWCKCEGCGQEFRREQGWWTKAVNNKMHPQKWFDTEYICGDCIESEEELFEHLKTKEHRWNTPPKVD